MGAEDDPGVIVDPDPRLLRGDGLRIADAAVFPKMVGVNIASTCMMVGLRCAGLILQERAGAAVA